MWVGVLCALTLKLGESLPPPFGVLETAQKDVHANTTDSTTERPDYCCTSKIIWKGRSIERALTLRCLCSQLLCYQMCARYTSVIILLFSNH